MADRGRLEDIVWLQRRRAEGWSVKRLAAELDVDHHIAPAALRRAGLPIPLPRTLRYPKLHDVDWLRDALATMSTQDVARRLGCAPQSVRSAARKSGVPALVNGHDPPPAVAAVGGPVVVGWATTGRRDDRRAGGRAWDDDDRVAKALRAGWHPPLPVTAERGRGHSSTTWDGCAPSSATSRKRRSLASWAARDGRSVTRHVEPRWCRRRVDRTRRDQPGRHAGSRRDSPSHAMSDG